MCPLIESSMASEMAAAEERQAHLAQIFGADKVGLLHGAMAAAAKDEMMARFTADELKILVSTTVIEVGVNVPNASIMVIEQRRAVRPCPVAPVARARRARLAPIVLRAAVQDAAE